MTRIDEIAPDVFRISVFVPQANMQFNQFLVRDDEPLLYHTGLKAHFPLIKEAVERLMNPADLRWIGFSHFESDECGALNEWLSVAPNSEAITGLVGAMVNVNDFAIRPARSLQDNESFSTGKRTFRYIRTPHVPHGWDAGLFYEETDKTLFTSDLFHHNGDMEPITGHSLSERCHELLSNYQQSPFADYIPYSEATGNILTKLARLEPQTLAIMHGSSFSGNGKQAIEQLADIWREVLARLESLS